MLAIDLPTIIMVVDNLRLNQPHNTTSHNIWWAKQQPIE